jgi:hypothetical protein
MYVKSLMFPLVESPFLLVKFQFVMANSSILPSCSWWLDQHFNGKIPIVVGEIAISFTDVPPKNWPQPSLQQGRRGVCWAAPAGALHIAWGFSRFQRFFSWGKYGDLSLPPPGWIL